MDGQDSGDGNWLAGLAADVEATRFADYLLDAAVVDQAAKDITAYLRDELGVPMPNAAVRFGLRLLAAALHDRGKKGADRLLSGTLGGPARAFARLPYCNRFCDAFRRWLRGKAEDGRAAEQFEALVKGDRSRIDPDLLSGLSLDMRVQLRQLSDLNGLRDAVDHGFRDVLERLNPQPQLDSKRLNDSDHARLHFGAGRIPFVGREAELVRLYQFLAMDGDFRWWTLLGEGGMGKSRLAMELCLRAGMHWRAGFLPRGEATAFWRSWQPESPTLLVVDYAGSAPEEVGEMLEALRLREWNAPLDNPVRVLLLERRREDRWWNAMINAGNGTALEQLSIKEGAPFELASLGDDGLWAIIRSLGVDRADALGRDTALARLHEIDREGRPLFAALAGEALAADADLGHWNKTDLLANWLRRERDRHWRPAGVDEQHANLAALATMTQGIADDVLASPPQGIRLPSPEDVDPVMYAAVTGRRPIESSRPDGSCNHSFMHLEPDILGTWFVLEHLRDPLGKGLGTPAARTVRADNYKHTAWCHDTTSAYHFAIFLDRGKDDFLGNALFRRLIDRPAGGGVWSRRLWCTISVALVSALGEAGDLAAASAQLEAMGDLAAAHLSDTQIRLRYAQGSVNLIFCLAKASDVAGASARLDALRRLAAARPREAELRLEFAKGSVILTICLAEAGDLAGASARLDALRILAAAHPSESELRLQYAQGSVNLISALGDACDISGASSRLDALRDVATAHLSEVELRRLYASGGVNLISYLAQAGDLAGASGRLNALSDLATAHPSDADLRLRHAQGCFNLIVYLAEAHDVAEVSRRLDALNDLAAKHPTETDLRLELAKGSFHLIVGLVKMGDIDRALERLHALGGLAAAHATEPELWMTIGLAACVLLYVYRRVGAQEKATTLMLAYQPFLAHKSTRDRLPQMMPEDARSLMNWIDGLKGDG